MTWAPSPRALPAWRSACKVWMCRSSTAWERRGWVHGRSCMPHKVLVVEDDAAILEPRSYNLGSEGHQVDSVADGAAALAAVRKSATDVVILDLMLPGMDGFEVTRALRKDNNVPILMLTARDDEID